MKQISARTFRVAFPTLTESVTVSTRGEGGEIRLLGTWTPAIPYADTWGGPVSGPGVPPSEYVVVPFTPAPNSQDARDLATAREALADPANAVRVPLDEVLATLRPFTPVPKPSKRKGTP